jgi:outer membrane biosynthesis protein TonB
MPVSVAAVNDPATPFPAAVPTPARFTEDVVRTVMPEPREQDLSTIDGSVDVSIRVEIDKRGNVQSAHVDSRGPSRYFADLSTTAARTWNFQPGQDDRQRVIDFQFTSAGARVTAVR